MKIALKRRDVARGLLFSLFAIPAATIPSCNPLNESGESKSSALSAAAQMDQVNFGIYVDLKKNMLYVVENNTRKVLFESRVITGRDGEQTPIMRAAVSAAIVMPMWRLPKSASDKMGLTRSNFPDDFVHEKGLFAQKPGRNNPLGPIKFRFEDGGAILMHGTNHPELFGTNYRDQSSGCVRVERLAELSDFILSSTVPKRTSIIAAIKLAADKRDFRALSPLYDMNLPIKSGIMFNTVERLDFKIDLINGTKIMEIPVAGRAKRPCPV
ncbi:MAG: L,D-transpeptidase, partial [Alphaproteobacteria bacterium]|nr:L,D-transpeptidase [Alphaproteobacteria bacterium]